MPQGGNHKSMAGGNHRAWQRRARKVARCIQVTLLEILMPYPKK
jgi:hypothetical protein